MGTPEFAACSLKALIDAGFDVPLVVTQPDRPKGRGNKLTPPPVKVFAQTKYPFIVSTKSILPQEEPYYSLFKECNCVFQVSLVCKTLQEKFEINTPTFNERLNFIKKMSKAVKRLVVRCQPYIIDYHKEIRENIKKYAELGVYGIVFEAIKFQKSNKNLVQIGADFCYPNEILKNKFLDLREKCHKYGLKFLSGENRFRNMGDKSLKEIWTDKNNFRLNRRFTPNDLEGMCALDYLKLLKEEQRRD